MIRSWADEYNKLLRAVDEAREYIASIPQGVLDRAKSEGVVAIEADALGVEPVVRITMIVPASRLRDFLFKLVEARED